MLYKLKNEDVPVAILLATYRGANYLEEQLDSYLRQEHGAWRLYASDDNSDDSTLDILKKFSRSVPGRVQILSGPRAGAAANFISLLNVDSDSEYFAFSDQDDVWLPSKLKCAINVLREQADNRPAIYASRVMICNHELEPLRISPVPTRSPSFHNALVQNILIGHTIVANKCAVDLLRYAASMNQTIVAHDWWVYQTVTAMGGKIIFDTNYHALYRQHDKNLIGAFPPLYDRLSRFKKGVKSEWMNNSLNNLSALADCIPQCNLDVINSLKAARMQGKIKFANSCFKNGLYTQGPFGVLAPAGAALLGVI